MGEGKRVWRSCPLQGVWCHGVALRDVCVCTHAADRTRGRGAVGVEILSLARRVCTCMHVQSMSALVLNAPQILSCMQAFPKD